MAMIYRLLHSKLFPPALPPPNTFADHIVLITGATGGLGLETAIQYVNFGASTVIITGRTFSKGEAAKAIIESRTGKTGIVHVRELNMDTLAGVRAFVDALIAEVKSIDIVLLNAGVYNMGYEQSPDGWEQDLQVNALSTILLGLLLLPWIQKSAHTESRLQHLGFVSSGLHTTAKITDTDFPQEDILKTCSQQKRFLSGQAQYALSKLFMMYGVEEITKLAQGEGGKPIPIVNTMCPGICKSDLGRQYTSEGYMMRIGVAVFFGTLAKSTEAGARTFVLSALTGPEEHGKYIKHYGTEDEYRQQASRNLTNEAGQNLQAQVWKEMTGIFQAASPEVSQIAKSKL